MAEANNNDIAAMSDEELMDQWTALGDQVQAARDRLKAFSAEHQRRSRKEQLARLGSLSDEDMALLQEVRAEGIETEEHVSVPMGSDD